MLGKERQLVATQRISTPKCPCGPQPLLGQPRWLLRGYPGAGWLGVLCRRTGAGTWTHREQGDLGRSRGHGCVPTRVTTDMHHLIAKPGWELPESPSVLPQSPSLRRQGYLGLHFANYSIASPEGSVLLFDCTVCTAALPKGHSRTGLGAAAPQEAAPLVPPRCTCLLQPRGSRCRGAPSLPSPRPDVTCPGVCSLDGGFSPFFVPDSRCPSCRPRPLTINPELHLRL